MNEKLRKILIILCVLVLLGAGAVVVYHAVQANQKRDLDEQVRELYSGEAPQTDMLDIFPGAQANSSVHTIPTPVGAKPTAVPAATESADAAVTDAPTEAPATPAAETAKPLATAAQAPASDQPADTQPTAAPAASPTPIPAVPTIVLPAEERDAFGRPFHLAEEVELPPVHRDFSKLLEANSDTIGWLKLPDMVDLPVMYRDNDFYLDYNFFRQADTNGTLFLNMHNILYPRDDVLLIHGHHMTSTGAMFGYLPRYGSYAYVQAHPLAYFRTIYDEEDQVYVPVAAFTASMKEDEPDFYDIMQLAFNSLPGAPADGSQTLRNSPEFQQYLGEIAAMSKWQSPVDVNVDDQLLMLVTCISDHNDGRFMLVLRKLRPGETEAAVWQAFNPDAPAAEQEVSEP